MAMNYPDKKISKIVSFSWSGLFCTLFLLNCSFVGFPRVFAKTPCLSGKVVGLPPGQILRVRSGPSTSNNVIDNIKIGTRFKVTGFELDGSPLNPDKEDNVDLSKGTTTWLKIAFLNSQGSKAEGWVNYLYVECSAEKYTFPTSEKIEAEPTSSGGNLDPVSTTPCSDDLSKGIQHPVPSGSPGDKFDIDSNYMFCRFHTGEDTYADRSAPILAAADGIVVHIGNMWYKSSWKELPPFKDKGRGPVAIIIEHAPGLYTTYSHNSSVADGVKIGTCVKKGQLIAGVGSLGYSEAPHLHFEVVQGVNFTGNWETPFPAPTRGPSDPICKAYRDPASYY